MKWEKETDFPSLKELLKPDWRKITFFIAEVFIYIGFVFYLSFEINFFPLSEIKNWDVLTWISAVIFSLIFLFYGYLGTYFFFWCWDQYMNIIKQKKKILNKEVIIVILMLIATFIVWVLYIVSKNL